MSANQSAIRNSQSEIPSPLCVPPPRNLDIYRLVVARGLKQTEVAGSFGVTPVRICQIITRVRTWVDSSIGDWLFPRQDDFRFYAALAAAQIRIHELDDDPQTVLITGPDWNYQRTAKTANDPLISTANVSPDPLNPLAASQEKQFALNPCGPTESPPQYIEDLGRRLAELLMLWQKSRRITGAFKSWR
jgi:hypothetical protein